MMLVAHWVYMSLSSITVNKNISEYQTTIHGFIRLKTPICSRHGKS